MASGHVNRIKRPDTWLHRPMLQNVKKVLANPEPSTHSGHGLMSDMSPLTGAEQTSKRERISYWLCRPAALELRRSQDGRNAVCLRRAEG
jgi:hypothetical protein